MSFTITQSPLSKAETPLKTISYPFRSPQDLCQNIEMAVSFQNLEITLGAFHLGPLSGEFKSTGLYLIRGRNGSGKTTLLRSRLGRLKPKGKITGLPFPIGTSGVEPLLMGSWTVKENWEWFSKLLQKTTKIPDEIRPLLEHRVDHLSLGMKRQIELSLILSLHFPTYFFDEPLSALDAGKREFYAEKIQEASKESLVFLTSHFEESLFGTPSGVLELK